MADRTWVEKPGGVIQRERDATTDVSSWPIPKSFKKRYIRRHRHHVNQLLNEGKYLEAELAGEYQLPYYW